MPLAFLLLSVGLAALPPFYHSSSEVRNLVSSWASESLVVLPTVSVDAIEIRSGSLALRTFVVCGEHPRELITVETCLELIHEAKDLNVGTLRVVYNANPEAREFVEEGDECLRTNLRGVDTNRNWDAHWKPRNCASRPEECPGRQPLSEPQVREVRELMTSLRPDIVISIHSGTYKILTPFAFDEVEVPDVEEMSDLLWQVSRETVNAPVGPAAQMLHYKCPGNILDFAYENTYAIVTAAFEVYEGSDEAKSFLGEGHCFFEFNPSEVEEYGRTVQSWTSAVLDVISLASS